MEASASDNASVSVACAGCLGKIDGRRFLQCSFCRQTYDLECANVSEKRFYNIMPQERRDAWKCQSCICQQPKGGNINTPVRGAAPDDSPNGGVESNESINSTFLDQTTADSVDRVTVRRRPVTLNQSDYLSGTLDDTAYLDNIRGIVREELNQIVNERLGFLISNAIKEQLGSLITAVADLNVRVTALENKFSLMSNSSPTTVPLALVASNSSLTFRDQSGSARVPPQRVAVNNALPPPPTVQTAEAATPPQTAEAQASNQRDSSIPGDEQGWTEVKKRPRKLSGVMRGTAAPGATQLQASERRQYVHVYYLKIGTTVEQICSHLKSILDADVCTAEALKARGDYASFKLSVPSNFVKRVMDPANWPMDICIKPWRQTFRSKTEK